MPAVRTRPLEELARPKRWLLYFMFFFKINDITNIQQNSLLLVNSSMNPGDHIYS